MTRYLGAALLLLPYLSASAQSAPHAGWWRGPSPSYDSQDVTIETAGGRLLAGTLTVPSLAGSDDRQAGDGGPEESAVGATGIPFEASPLQLNPAIEASGRDLVSRLDVSAHKPANVPPGAAAPDDSPPPEMAVTPRVPAMVLISGSGPDNRDAAPRWMPGYQPFWQIADALTRRGIAVLRIDDRGVGLSTGEFEKSTIVDFADDVRAALDYLRGRPDIDAGRLGILGHSEGGVVAVMVAAEDPALKALALLASPGTDLRSVVADQLRYWLERDPSIPFAGRERILVQQLARWDVFADANPRLKFSRTYDPTDAVKLISAPVLILQGAADRQVPRKHAEKLAKALSEGGNGDVTLRILPYVDHLFLQDRSGNPGGYSQLTSRRIPGSVLEVLGAWAASRLGATDSSAIGAVGELSPRGAVPTTLLVPKQ